MLLSMEECIYLLQLPLEFSGFPHCNSRATLPSGQGFQAQHSWSDHPVQNALRSPWLPFYDRKWSSDYYNPVQNLCHPLRHTICRPLHSSHTAIPGYPYVLHHSEYHRQIWVPDAFPLFAISKSDFLRQLTPSCKHLLPVPAPPMWYPYTKVKYLPKPRYTMHLGHIP